MRSPQIPFYYIYGNHDEPASKQILDGETANEPGVHRLSKNRSGTKVEKTMLYGIDFSYAVFPGEPLELTPPTGANVLVVHDTPYPVKDDQGEIAHKKQGADFREAIEQTPVDIDLIISGHMHVGEIRELTDSSVPVLVTGAPAPINSGTNNNPSTWLLEVSDNGIENITRHPI